MKVARDSKVEESNRPRLAVTCDYWLLRVLEPQSRDKKTEVSYNQLTQRKTPDAGYQAGVALAPFDYTLSYHCWLQEKSQINEYEIPPKTRVAVNVWAIGIDPIYWDEARVLNLKGLLIAQLILKEHTSNIFHLVPEEGCVQVYHLLYPIELPLAMLLYHFDWKLHNGLKNEELDMSESFGFTLRRKSDLCLIPITRRP
ncbi:cytochrome p450 [Trifolium pratense]|uniref:Cytochrome p450 n=1 Tax=Trifolium pratense TaxID=57577 RepID=A0A2K3N0U3_TRIPR|nr:cytochrome p450 [Trifolium pratense]